MQRRTFVIPFERTFGPDEQQSDLFDQIWQDERSGVLNHVLAGFARVVKRGFKFEQPEDCVAARSKFFVESNPLRAFIAEQCSAVPAAKTRLTYIRAAFRAWAQENAIPAATLGGNKLRRNLELLGFEITKVKGYPYVHGLKLKNEKQFA
jgi:phage/plasmid-associated DNA primase